MSEKETKKWRKFWITQSIKSNNYCSVLESDHEFIGYRNIHVIEIGALDELKAKAEMLVQAMEQCQDVVQSYANDLEGWQISEVLDEALAKYRGENETD